MIFRPGGLTRRDAILLLVGASSMHIWSLLFSQHDYPSDQSIVINNHASQDHVVERITLTTTVVEPARTQTRIQTQTATVTKLAAAKSTTKSRAVAPFAELPSTEVLAHAPGWTLFRDVYMSNGTIFIVADENARKNIPEIRMMTSTGLPAENTPENIASREPLPENMQIITPEEAKRRWVTVDPDGKYPDLNRVWSVEGNTLLFNDPTQFLRHYYHLVAELFFGVQAFWHGAFSEPLSTRDALSPTSSIHYSQTHPAVPPIHRAIFAHSNADGWRDNPGFNRYFLRAAFPSLIVEHQEDWEDRIRSTRPKPGQIQTGERAWHFPMVLLTDRSAAHRGWMCGSNTQRTASEAWDYMRLNGKLRGMHVGGWWAPVREAIWRFAGADEGLKPVLDKARQRDRKEEDQSYFGPETGVVRGLGSSAPALDKAKVADIGAEHQKKLPMPSKVVITYISRQSARNRKLIPEDHALLIESLKELVDRKNKERAKFFKDANKVLGFGDDDRKRATDEAGGVPLEWELNVMEAEKLTHDQQIQAAARTTIMLGVHGNGLTHLVFMKPTRASTVIEMFYPGGFAHDYYWTSRALGMSHFAVWNDTHRTYPDKPNVDYPKGFQENSIPAHGPTVAQLIEDRVAMKL
ncbi:hypothetical protein BDN70DRAFT_110609 [Pholiota conissans]|uniref:Uncharacterized protein n=1 Tax=Pholiota conissans TaxID=109636 RepID=A0A9P5YXA9_9AGAR|nr:hypothetical protein BDN70DRAFT_110609 [Pholiota conissans]